MPFMLLVLVGVYICVLLIKVCQDSPQMCSKFGFGDSADGELN
jgi:hypothetical protein